MALEISGRLLKKLPKQSGEGKNGTWTKQDFVIETSEQYPKKICFSAWGDKASQIESVSEGTDLKVSFDVQAREYNDKWYNDLRPWKIEVVGSTTAVAHDAVASGSHDPFAPSPGQNDDDLPF